MKYCIDVDFTPEEEEIIRKEDEREFVEKDEDDVPIYEGTIEHWLEGILLATISRRTGEENASRIRRLSPKDVKQILDDAGVSMALRMGG